MHIEEQPLQPFSLPPIRRQLRRKPNEANQVDSRRRLDETAGSIRSNASMLYTP